MQRTPFAPFCAGLSCCAAACSSQTPPPAATSARPQDRRSRSCLMSTRTARARAHQGAVVGRVRGPRAGHQRRRADGRRTWSSEFTKAGLKPGNTDGTYVQKVPLVGITPTPAPLVLQQGRDGSRRSNGKTISSRGPSTWPTPRASTRRSSCSSATESSRPSISWDDYKGLDVKGKTIVMLVNDPPVPDPSNPATLDPKDVRRQGDDVLRPLDLQVRDRRGQRRRRRAHHPRDGAGRLSRSTWCRTARPARQFDLVTPDKNMGRASIEGWMTLEQATDALADGRPGFRGAEEAGRDARVQARAARRHGVDARFATRCGRSIRRTWSAKLEGTDPALKDEYVIYTAHWDHLGNRSPRGSSTARRTTRRARRRSSRWRARFAKASAAAEAIDPVSRGDGRGAGPARIAVLLR